MVKSRRHNPYAHLSPAVLEELRGRSEYKAAQRNRVLQVLRDALPYGSGNDYHFQHDRQFYAIMELGRMFDRDQAFVRAGVDRLVDNVVQNGFQYAPKTRDKGLNRELKERWKNWSTDPSSCDRSGRMTFHDFEEQAFREVVVSGGAFFLPTVEGQMLFLEYHRCKTPTAASTDPNMFLGVRHDDYGRPLEYWFTKYEVDARHLVQAIDDVLRYPAWDDEGNPMVFHIFKPSRNSQTRGVSFCHPVAQQAEHFDDLNDANLIRSKVLACFGFIRKIPIEAEWFGEGELKDRYPDSLVPMEPGLIVETRPGEEITAAIPNAPNPSYFEHANFILQAISISYKIPAEALLLDPRKSNLASWRGSWELAKIAFRNLQNWYASSLHRPAAQWKVRQWANEDRGIRRAIDAPGVSWADLTLFRPPSWDYTEPLKDVTAELIERKGGLNSPRRIAAERNCDWDEIQSEIVEDNSKIIRRAIRESHRIKEWSLEKFGVAEIVPWQAIASFTLPDGFKFNISANVNELDPANTNESEVSSV